MDGCCLISKSNFSRLVREIAREVTTGGVEHRFERDALVALQMATEHIMIMVFELTYNIHHSDIIDYRNKLAIHAKRVTIQPKDMSLLRELWHSIDPMSPIGDPTEQRRIITRAARIEAARQARGLPAATRLHSRLTTSGQRVPAGLKNFLVAHKHLRRS
jgi:histone H3/H4